MKVINRVRAAELLGMSSNALGCHVYRGSYDIPNPIKIGGKWRWIEEDIIAWLRQRREEAKGKSALVSKGGGKGGRPRKRRSASCA